MRKEIKIYLCKGLRNNVSNLKVSGVRKAIAQLLPINNKTIPHYVFSFLPIIDLLHVSLNARGLIFFECVKFLIRNHSHGELIYIVDMVYLKFG